MKLTQMTKTFKINDGTFVEITFDTEGKPTWVEYTYGGQENTMTFMNFRKFVEGANEILKFIDPIK